jgi:hypothetical protein
MLLYNLTEVEALYLRYRCWHVLPPGQILDLVDSIDKCWIVLHNENMYGIEKSFNANIIKELGNQEQYDNFFSEKKGRKSYPRAHATKLSFANSATRNYYRWREITNFPDTKTYIR